ncbi:hypothetical protein EJ02DRAFT_68592 [Clathrospora elynae]|uniref:Uncharacterized protein n=1 Tax=Clathrospora elynae TaxID=706981 RepID=A0A6A5SES3_9PLEO|nr:hypothetical protein EJ02DRAFT_68592 [Clathrospora elynae]
MAEPRPRIPIAGAFPDKNSAFKDLTSDIFSMGKCTAEIFIKKSSEGLPLAREKLEMAERIL